MHAAVVEGEVWSTFAPLTNQAFVLGNGTKPMLVYTTPRELRCKEPWTPAMELAKAASNMGLLFPTWEIGRVLERELPFSSDEKFHLLVDEGRTLVKLSRCSGGRCRLHQLPSEENMTGVPNLDVRHIFVLGYETT